MKTLSKMHSMYLAAFWLAPVLVVAQAQSPAVALNQEPHHHLVFQNRFVNVYHAKAKAGDSLLLHRHDHDAIAIAIGDQTTTIGVPGKPDVHSKSVDGQVRIQPVGYVHSTHVDGDADYFTVAIELLRPQTGERNLCAIVLAGQPLNCATVSTAASAAASQTQPEFKSDQTWIETTRIRPHESKNVGNLSSPEVVIVLDAASISPSTSGNPVQSLHPGDFVWIEKEQAPRVFKNDSEKDARLVTIALKP